MGRLPAVKDVDTSGALTGHTAIPGDPPAVAKSDGNRSSVFRPVVKNAPTASAGNTNSVAVLGADKTVAKSDSIANPAFNNRNSVVNIKL